jgi:two-component system, chemotaxis family, chemotaxis protein CheY
MTNVLVVDDDNDTVDVLCEYLRLKGMNVVGSAQNGQEALKLYKELKPDIVLLDVWMPDFDGYFGLQKIREFDPDAKVVMVTASAFSDSKKNKLKSMGASDVICKPYETSDVIKTIEEQTTGVVSKPTS